MSLTLEEKTNYAAVEAAEVEAAKHFFDAAQPFFPLGFSVGYRNPGHWDIYADQVPGKDAAWLTAHGEGSSINGKTVADVPQLLKGRSRERAFTIRGEPGKVTVHDQRWDPRRPHPRESIRFISVLGAMLFIVETLMQEPVKSSTINS